MKAFDTELDEHGLYFWDTLRTNEIEYGRNNCEECARIRKERGQLALRLVAASKMDDDIEDNRNKRLELDREHRRLGRELVLHMANEQFIDEHPMAAPPFFRDLQFVESADTDVEDTDAPSESPQLGPDEDEVPVFSDEEDPACHRGITSPIILTGDLPVRARTGRHAIKAGDLAIIRLEEPEDGLPWAVTTVISVHSTALCVHWYGNRNSNPTGAYLPFWNCDAGYYPSEKPAQPSHTPFTDYVRCSSVIDWDFQLTRRKRLPKAVLDYLRYLPRVDWK